MGDALGFPDIALLAIEDKTIEFCCFLSLKWVSGHLPCGWCWVQDVNVDGSDARWSVSGLIHPHQGEHLGSPLGRGAI